MVIDTSALVAMLSDEPDAERFEAAVEADHIRLMSTASYLETALVIEARFGEPADVSWICGFIAPRSTLLPCMPTKRMPRAPPTARTAREGIVRGSTTATASHTASPRSAASHSCSRAKISNTPTSPRSRCPNS